jgi:hypothetical protein
MAKNGLTKQSDITILAREIDFVSRFTRNWDALREVMNIMRPICKAAGTTLVSYNADVTLESGAVGEGDEIPYSQATVTPVTYADLTIDKYAKAVSIEAVSKYGATAAVQKTDEAFLNELQGKVMGDFYSFIQTGTLIDAQATFQMAIAMAIGKVRDKFKKMHKNESNITVFVNTLDYYRYLGSANISTQTLEGITYVKDFMGASTMIITSDIPEGKIIGIPADNTILYYVDPSDSEFAQLGLNYTVEGETNLIGFHANGDYAHAVGESFAIMGMKLWAEYIDAISIVYIGTSTAVTSAETVTAKSGTTTVFDFAHSPVMTVDYVEDNGAEVKTGWTKTDTGIVFDTAPTGTVKVKYHYAAAPAGA